MRYGGNFGGKYPNEGVKIIRYVDDYLFTGRSKEIMECVLNDLQGVLGDTRVNIVRE